ncbi:sensor histidine kinase [Actinophytocola oryzae]|uniref:histidine kinase n=1 Tax=Actinophytocola oryzae TaxID=502181 RepID=A0A4R7USD1_9PSEU|nr:sensor histidine kinase [Actinophytocola oryzae]TDV34514.1 signal transduction histidine kinase [Actinophytocola oryzae]
MLSLVRSTYLILVDIFVAVAMLAFVGYAAIDTGPGATVVEPEWVSLLVATVITGPIALRRWMPLPALMASTAGAAFSVVSGVIPLVAFGAPITAVALVLYLVASDTPRRRSTVSLAACVGMLVVVTLGHRLLGSGVEPWWDTLFGIAFSSLELLTAWTLGFATRERRRHAQESASRQAEQAVAEERLRIARELHDIVAHSMTVIAVKAGIGNHVAEQRPSEAHEALRVIEATSRGSLIEMRHLLGVLRSEVDGVEFTPTPGPAGISTLVDRARSAGVTVSVKLDDTDGLSEGIGLSVYRIVQEALTNVVRHAAPTRCGVTLSVRDDKVGIEVVNDGPRVEAGQGGHGVIGMRERVAVYGGTFSAGPRAEGGWRVSAVLPR